MGSKKPKNPCIKICKLDRDSGLCRGCLRTRDEIRGWKDMSRKEREGVLEAVELRRRADEADGLRPPQPMPRAPDGDGRRPSMPGGAGEAAPAASAGADAVVARRESFDRTDGAGARRWRHRESGGIYLELHRALLERDQTPMVVYRGEDGRIWVRPAAQFDDGRFEPA